MTEHTITYRLNEINKAAKDFLLKTASHRIIAFHGPMGSGKTTFIAALCHALGCAENVSSPTFSIINEYYAASNGKKVCHADLYRLNSAEEALHTGIEDYLNDAECINFIEWPETIEELLPAGNTIHAFFEIVSDTERTIRIVVP
jgi:tRNA threonylcarbamoyladenosine biosynthesis protein TsaE